MDKMISYTLSGVSEGQARLDKEYYTGEFSGEGKKVQHFINYTFEGIFSYDEPSLGNYVSSFLTF